MPELRLVACRDPARLLEHAADGFLTPLAATRHVPFPSPGYLLAVRQNGIRDDLLVLAGARGVTGWFDPPLCTFRELPERLGTSGRVPCGEFERVVLLGHVLRRAARRVFGSTRHPEDFVDGVDRLFGELAAEDVAAERFAAALTALGERDDFEVARDADLAAAYALYQRELARENRRDGRDNWADCARAIRADPVGLGKRLGGRREIRIFGLHDLRGGWPILLAALKQSPALDRVTIYSGEVVELDRALECEVVRLDEPESIAVRLFVPAVRADASHSGRTSPPVPLSVPERGDVVNPPSPGGRGGQGVRIGGAGPSRAPDPASERAVVVAAPDAEREAEEIARRVRSLADAGVPLERIAVVSRQARPYMDLVVNALERFGVPATARRRFAYREIPVIRAVLALLDAAAEGWSRHGLAELAEQPYFGSELSVRILNFAGYRSKISGLDGWREALARLEDEARERERQEQAGEELDEYRKPLPSSARVAAARAAFARFTEQARALTGARPLAEWLAWLERFLGDDPWGVQRRIYRVPERRFEVARLDLRGWKDLKEILAEWGRAVERWGGGDERLGVDGFRVRLAELLSGDAAVWGETQRGVRVLEGLAAAYRAFDHVFIVGMNAGRFPVRAPLSPILEESDRERLAAAGIPLELRAAWDRRERELLRALVAAARTPPTASYARLDAAGWELVRSSFVDALAEAGGAPEETIPTDRVVTPGLPLYPSEEVARHAAAAARIELLRKTGAVSPYNGLIEDAELLRWLGEYFGDDQLWSPTQLEAYAKCPWAYFSGRLLRIEKLEEPDEELDPAARGVVLHDALHRFYDGAKARLGRPVLLRAADLKWAVPLALAALDDAIAAAGDSTWLGHPALRDAKRQEMRRILEGYLAWEVGLNEEMYDPRKKKAPAMVRTGVEAGELAIPEAVLDRNGVRFRYRGTIDRVEVGVDDRVAAGGYVAAVDYKTSLPGVPGSGDPKAWADGVVLQVPLYAHALTQLRPGVRVARVEYRSLRTPQAAHSLQLHQVEPKKGLLLPNAEARDLMQRALDAVAAHVRRARGGEFPARPAPSCGCPPFCHAWDICRVAGGPQTKRER